MPTAVCERRQGAPHAEGGLAQSKSLTNDTVTGYANAREMGLTVSPPRAAGDYGQSAHAHTHTHVHT